MEYRKRKGTFDTWHFCKNCHLWPTSNYETRTTKPTGRNELCDHCLNKDKAANCRK
jgi:hypothetical protein